MMKRMFRISPRSARPGLKQSTLGGVDEVALSTLATRRVSSDLDQQRSPRPRELVDPIDNTRALSRASHATLAFAPSGTHPSSRTKTAIAVRPCAFH